MIIHLQQQQKLLSINSDPIHKCVPALKNHVVIQMPFI